MTRDIARLDSVLHIETPEGVSLSLPLAGPAPRTLAFLIDLLIRAAIMYAVASAVGVLGKTGNGLFLILLFMVEWLYPVLFEVYFSGATPGKRLMNLAVVEKNGLPVSWQASLVRNLLRFADFMPFMYGFGFLSMMFTRSFQRLGDLAAGTVVVWRPKARAAMAIPDAPVMAPSARLTLDEQETLAEFAARQDEFSPERQKELSDLAQPLTGRTGQSGLQALLGIAAFLAGKR